MLPVNADLQLNLLSKSAHWATATNGQFAFHQLTQA
jgi:hypothetical protein